MKHSSGKFLQTSYIKGDGFLHSMKAGHKLMAMVIIGLFVYGFPYQVVAQWVGWVFLIGIIYMARLPLQKVAQYMRPFLIFLVYITIVFMFFRPWQQAILYGLRILLLLAYSALFVLTTAMQDMQDMLFRLFRLSKYIGLKPKNVAMSFTLTIRMIPMLAGIFENIVDARKARGLKAGRIMVIIPTIIAAFNLARYMSEALDSRGWDQEEEDQS